MNIILCGMPGCGKSYYGALAAKQMNWPFIDTDERIKEEYGHSCRDIVLKEGESFFRDLETQILKRLNPLQQAIIAVGGGAFDRAENIELLKGVGRLIYLKVTPEILFQRAVTKTPLPSYLDLHDLKGSFEALYQRRLPLYEKYCHLKLDVGTENVLACISQECAYGK